MRFVLAYIGVILIWSTTPLAIQWSIESVSYVFSICARFVLSAVFVALILIIKKQKLDCSRQAIQAYLAGGLGICSMMLCAYWSLQYLPSGWMSIISGVTPIITALFAILILGEKGLNLYRSVGIVAGILGLLIMMESGFDYGSHESLMGVFIVLTGCSCYSLCLVILKKINSEVDILSSVAGTILIAMPITLGVWFFLDGEIPYSINTRPAFSIIYLASVGSIIGFLLLYYVLRRTDATRTAVISLITPATALLLGHWLNNEPMSRNILFGCLFILAGLILFQYDQQIRNLIFKRKIFGEKI